MLYGLLVRSIRLTGAIATIMGHSMAQMLTTIDVRSRLVPGDEYKDIRFAPKTVWLEAMQRRPTRRAVAGVASRRAPSDPAAPTDARLGRRTRRSAALTS